MERIDREMMEMLDNKLQQEVVSALCKVSKNFGVWVFQPEELIRKKIEFLTSTAFGSGNWNKQAYMIALFGAITPSSALEDFCYYVDREVPVIQNYFESDHGIRPFVGKWVVTKYEHSSMSTTIPAETVVKITELGDRGYTIQTEFGDRVSEIGFEV